mgnify:CR=1 FL=1
MSRDSSRPHDRVISLQRADGSWELDAKFARAVSMKLRGLEKAPRDAIGDPEVARRALATAIANAWLEKFAADARGEWEMLAEKARRLLTAVAPRPGAAFPGPLSSNASSDRGRGVGTNYVRRLWTMTESSIEGTNPHARRGRFESG